MRRVTSYNAGNASDKRVRDDAERLAARRPVVIGWQEVADRGPILRNLSGYACVQLHTEPNAAHVALSIRDDLPYTNVRLKALNRLTWVGRLVAGARKSGKSKAKYVLSARVDGDEWGDTHLVPSWTRKRCVLARRLAKKQVKGCVEWFQAGGDVLVMDGNGPADHKVFAPLRKVAVPYARGKSHGIERDIVWVRKGAAAHVVVRALDGYSSDHPPVEADITWARKAAPEPKGNTSMGNGTAAAVVAAARSQVGYHEGRSGGHWNNREKYAAQVAGLEWANYQPWCATFVAWCFTKAGAIGLVPKVSASCDISASGWKHAGRWSEYPAIGAQVFYGTPRDLVHTGLVVAFDDDTITTVEGNTNDNGSREGDGVYVKRRRRRDAYVVGYGYPEYPEGIVSADPRYRHKRKPKAQPKGPTRVTRARNRLTALISLLSDAVETRPKAVNIKAALRKARQARKVLPRR